MSADPDLLDLTAEIVTAHAAHSLVGIDRLPELIRSVHRTLSGLASGQAPARAPVKRQPEPAVPIQCSVTPDYVVCLECGEHGAMLKRHVAARHGLTLEAYRTRWGLPRDHPLVAPRFAERRAALARQTGPWHAAKAAKVSAAPARGR